MCIGQVPITPGVCRANDQGGDSLQQAYALPSAQSMRIFQAICLAACRCPNTHRLSTSLKSEVNGGFLAFTFATASDMAEEIALVAVANAWALALATDVTFPPVDTASALAMLLVSPLFVAACSCRQQDFSADHVLPWPCCHEQAAAQQSIIDGDQVQEVVVCFTSSAYIHDFQAVRQSHTSAFQYGSLYKCSPEHASLCVLLAPVLALLGSTLTYPGTYTTRESLLRMKGA